MIGEYFCVTAQTSPWISKSKQVVGFYKTKELAVRVASWVEEINKRKLPGGIEMKVEPLNGELTESDNALTVKISQEEIRVVKIHLDRDEVSRLAGLKFQEM